ncbi:MAG: tyrosine-type recombinase/integrase, partial [Planctomycetaceae bacterium]
MTRSAGAGIDFDGKSFPFTQARIEEAVRLVAEGRIETDGQGRRSWSDDNTQGLRLVVGARGGVFTFAGRIDGKTVTRSIGPAGVVKVAEAREAVGKLRFDSTAAATLAPRPAPPATAPGAAAAAGPTVGAVVGEYLKAHASGRFLPGRRKSAPTARTIDFYADVYAATLRGEYDAAPLSKLAADFPRVFDALSKRAPYQGNRMLQLVRNVFAYAVSVGQWNGPNPAVDTGVGQRVTRNQEHHRERFLTDAEAARLHRALAADLPLWRDLFTTSLTTGQRMGACCRMRWSDLELSGRSPCWRIPRADRKGRKGGHVVPLAGELLAILMRRQAEATAGVPWVFPAEEGEGAVEVYKGAWKRVIERAGLWSDDPEQRPRPHDLRRTCGARMTAA